MNPNLHGLWPAMLTPLDAGGQIDAKRAIEHARHLLKQGCDGVSIFGTTGEGPSFSIAERQELLKALLEAGIKPERVMVAISAAALPDAIELSRHASSLGCSAQLFIPPFYFGEPSDAGVVKSTTELLQALAGPPLRLLLYHIPALSRISFSSEAIAELQRRHPQQVLGVKDSTGDRSHSLKLVQQFPQLSIFVGSEVDIAPVMQAGGAGSICGLANIAPGLVSRIVAGHKAPAAQDLDAMGQLLGLIGTEHFLPVFKTIMAEQQGQESWQVLRAPLMPLDPDKARAVREGFKAIAKVRADL